MHKFKLFVAPRTCARVPTIALEEIGVPFETQLVRTAAKEQKTPEYLALNPKGKVPLLIVDGVPLTENVAINSWLNETYPEANLLPKTESSFEKHLQIADLAFVAATIHPNVTRIAMPVNIAKSEAGVAEVKQVGLVTMKPFAQLIENRLSEGTWWYGDQWSIVDGYIFWAWSRMVGQGFSDDAYPKAQDFCERIQQRPSVDRAMQREAKHVAQLAAEKNA